MENKTNNNDLPTCGCVRGDLYMESLKLKEIKKEVVSETIAENPEEENSHPG